MERAAGRLFLAALIIILVTGCATMQGRWERAASADTIAAYGEFLQKHPEGDLAERARLRQAVLYETWDWQEAAQLGSASAYAEYLRNHPQGRYREEASRRLSALASPQPQSEPPSVTGEALLRRHQQGHFREETLVALENDAFAEALRSDTARAYEAFLERYPSGRYADEARRRIDVLRHPEAQAKHAFPAQGDLNRYRQGRQTDEASVRRETKGSPAPKPTWGAIMYAKRKANIRAKRSTSSSLRGRLAAGQRIKADFFRDGWYAVFSPSEKRRDERKALGYVHAPLLAAAGGGAASPGSREGKGRPADAPAKEGDALYPFVAIKGITFRMGGDGKEFLCVAFDRFCAPALSGAEGEEPKILLEIDDAAPLAKEWTLIDAQGRFVRRVVARQDAATRKALIVLHMEPAKSYLVNPKFFARDSTYCLEIAEEEPVR